MMKKIFLSFLITVATLGYTDSPSSSTKGYTLIQDQNTLHILNPALATRRIAKIRLDNGLEAYLVSDPSAEASAAALAVHVGSWSDPKDFPGMAHFLEHMLFMGTKTYPDENAFSQYVTDHGGHTNAYTALDRTVYMFSINNDAFTHGLDLFSHFFIDPLFKTSEVGRELHAVDQEHAKNIQNDFRRKWMIFKETGNQNHPNRAFSTGNAETLGHIPREALLQWYEKNYSSSLMHLALYSPLPMEKLIELAVSDFSNIPARTPPKEISYAPLSSEMQQGHVTYITPIKDLKILSLEWELPKITAKDQETKSAQLIAYALQYGGELSLIEELKKEELAENLYADVQDLAEEHALLQINILLTKEGVLHRNTVLERCFQTLALFRQQGIPSYLFDEMHTMSTLDYEYQSRSDPFEFVATVAGQLVDESLATYPEKTLVASHYDAAGVEALLRKLTPKNCIIYLMAPSELTGISPDKKERWTGGEYTIKTIPDTQLKAWMNASLNPNIHLPSANPYIPQDLSLVHTAFSSPSSVLEVPPPLLIQDSKEGKSYVWEDIYYQTPEIVYLLGFKTPLLDGTAKGMVATDLWMKTFYQKVSPTLSLADTAGLSASVEQKNFTLFLQLCGYSEKAPELLLQLLSTMKTLSCTQEEFKIYQASLLSTYENQQKAEPYVQAGEFLSNALYNDAPLSSEKADALRALTYEEFSHFAGHLFTECFVQGLYTGNLTHDDAMTLVKEVHQTLTPRPYPLEDQHAREVLLLSKEEGPYAITRQISVMGNAALLAIEQGPFSFEKKASQLLLATLFADSFYTTLRSQQQTGYIASSWPREVQQQLLQFFLVQSNTHDPQDLLARFELFLEGYIKDFSGNLSTDRFQEIQENCIITLSQPPANLGEMSGYLESLAFERKGDFSFTQKLLTALEQLTYETLKQDTSLFFSRKNTKRLALLAEGEIQENFLYKATTAEALRKQGSFISYK